MHVGYREDEAPDLRPRGFTPRRPPSFLSSLPSLLPKGLLNWHRFRTAPDSKSLPKCFHSATPVAALCSLGADRLRAKLFHEVAVAWDDGFALRGTQGFPLFFIRESQRLRGPSSSAEWRCKASQSDGCSEQKYCNRLGAGQKRPLFEGPILGARADTSESPYGRIQSDSFILLRLGGVENFPQHIPGLGQRRE